jgi:hypothetical protein
MKRGFGLILLAAAMTAGCATSTMTAAVVTRTSTGASARPASPSAPAPPSTAGQSTKQRAEAAAAALLAEFVPPPGARRLAGPPNLPGGWEQHPQSVLVSNSMVDQAAFWEAPGDPQSLLSWEQARLTGKRFTLGDADFGPPSWDREFDLPAAGALTNRELIVEVVGAGNGQTAIRLDADIAWQPSRPPGDLVPNAARVVTISELASGNPQAKRPPAPATITDPAVVGRLAALVDSLPVSPLNNEAVSCPAAFGVSLQLAFRPRAGGPVVALAQTDQPCGMVDFTVTGHQLLGLENNTNVDRQILAIASLPWKLPNALRARRTTRSVLGCQPRRSNRQPSRSAAISLVLPSALVTIGEEPPDPRSLVACVFRWSLIPRPGNWANRVSLAQASIYGRCRLVER